MPPMGDARHPLGGKGTIPMTLRDNPQAPRNPYLRPTEAAPPTRGGGTFDPRRRHLRPKEPRASQGEGATMTRVKTLCIREEF